MDLTKAHKSLRDLILVNLNSDELVVSVCDWFWCQECQQKFPLLTLKGTPGWNFLHCGFVGFIVQLKPRNGTLSARVLKLCEVEIYGADGLYFTTLARNFEMAVFRNDQQIVYSREMALILVIHCSIIIRLIKKYILTPFLQIFSASKVHLLPLKICGNKQMTSYYR